MANEFSVLRDGLFEGRVALVTGAGRGMGQNIALRFAQLGATVVASGRHMETLEQTKAAIEAAGGECFAEPCDIRDTEQVDALVKAAAGRSGQIDSLVNNAGGQFPARPSEISDRGWRSVVDLNLNGTWNMLSRVGPLMLDRKFGAVVNIVHVYSFDRGAPAFVHSGAARAGVVSLTRTLANYWARHNITINALAPGSISTEALREREYAQLGVENYEEVQLQDVPAHRLGERDEMAEICAFLCSPAARYITGSVITADGGQSVANWTDVWDMERP